MKLIKWLLILFIWLALFSSIAVTWSLLNLPETESIQISRQPSITFLDKDGRIIASYGDVYGQSINFADLPDNLINAVIVTEDKSFFSHPGIDFKGVAREGLFSALKHYKYDGLAILVSARGHYSLKKSADILGLGSDSVIAIPTDENNRIDCQLLKNKCQELQANNIKVWTKTTNSNL